MNNYEIIERNPTIQEFNELRGAIGWAESGCICGALAGGTMVLGYLAGEGEYRPELAQKFRDEFVAKFGSACCRVIRQNQSITGRFRNKKCREITGFAAGVLHSLTGSRRGAV